MNKNIIAIFLIIVSVLIYPFFVSDIRSDTDSLKEDVKVLKETIKNVEDFTTIKNSLLRKSEELSEDDLDNLEKMLPKEINAVQVALDIQELALKNSLILEREVGIKREERASQNVTANQNQAEEDLFNTVSFHINLVGSYESLVAFLASLAESRTIFNVTSLSFAVDETNLFSFDIELITYELSDTFLERNL